MLIKEKDVLPGLNFLNQLPKKSVSLPTLPAAPKVEKNKNLCGEYSACSSNRIQSWVRYGSEI